MITNETRLKVILDRKSSEETLLENVQQLHLLSESRDFWANIVSDNTYSPAHRRIAFIQYFIRHTFYRKACELRVDSLDLLPSEFYIQVNRWYTGPIAPEHKDLLDDSRVNVACKFAGVHWSGVQLSIFPAAQDSELIEIMSGKISDASQVITAVTAQETLTSGAYIDWKRWQRGQVCKYYEPRSMRLDTHP